MTARHLYVHVPFCARRCAYCDFSIAVRRATPVDEYLNALEAELGSRLGRVDVSLNNGDLIETLYFGGGTPSRLGPEGVRRMLTVVRRYGTLAQDAEITLEANPEDVTAEAAHAWREAGVNRISLGVQTFDDSVLTWMHRTHSVTQSREAVSTLRSAGFTNISVDLIFALPTELGRSWSRDLEETFILEPDHVSLYGLTIEEFTPLSRWTSAGRSSRPTDDHYAEEFLMAHRAATDAGLEHYEVSNFAKPGRRSRHNSTYWSGAPYLGVGPSAHSFDGLRRSWNVSPYTDWVTRLREGSDVTQDVEDLSDSNRAAERVYLGLRTVAGYRASPADIAIARGWADAGWAGIEGDVIRLTPEGWLRLDALSSGLTGF
ncbi:MAG TPA: radical SAM family heme chaperone HemW [Gemmatimonadaceae bacterium]|nr:radical SAM family heme chaperone HemW [Gemmatimonadaceae bacterium]